MSTTSDPQETQGEQQESLGELFDRIPDNWNGEGQYSMRLIRSDEGKEAIVTVIEPPRTMTQQAKTLIVDPQFLVAGSWYITKSQSRRLFEFLRSSMKEEPTDFSISLQGNGDILDGATLLLENGVRDLKSLAQYRLTKGPNGTSTAGEKCMVGSVNLTSSTLRAFKDVSAKRLQGMFRSLNDGWSRTLGEEMQAEVTLLLRAAMRDKARSALNECKLRHAVLKASCSNAFAFVEPISDDELDCAQAALKVSDERFHEAMQAAKRFLSLDNPSRITWKQVFQSIGANATANVSPSHSTPKRVRDTVSDQSREPTVHLVRDQETGRISVMGGFLSGDRVNLDGSAAGHPNPVAWVNDEPLENGYTFVTFEDFTRMLSNSVHNGKSKPLDDMADTLRHLVSKATADWRMRYAELQKIERDPEAINRPSIYRDAFDRIESIPTERKALFLLFDLNRTFLNSQSLQHLSILDHERMSSLHQIVNKYDGEIQKCMRTLGYTPGSATIGKIVRLPYNTTEGKITAVSGSASSAGTEKSTRIQRAQETMSESSVPQGEEKEKEEEKKKKEKKKKERRNAKSRQNKRNKELRRRQQLDAGAQVPLDFVDAASSSQPSLATWDDPTKRQMIQVSTQASDHKEHPTFEHEAAAKNSSISPTDRNDFGNPLERLTLRWRDRTKRIGRLWRKWTRVLPPQKKKKETTGLSIQNPSKIGPNTWRKSSVGGFTAPKLIRLQAPRLSRIVQQSRQRRGERILQY
ncbi:hypothetical protein DB88DRAFT_546944 [Papiliotrema laurentii]|uniref:Uncharacterized protein n=1 Tax=Papiliotrema laurentii TaxID=5418 RepID=A0AAD9CWG4_PAPLA|nr:hypothetical protein DB88DRAFT_546944 [Papiliotrema laurentii]